MDKEEYDEIIKSLVKELELYPSPPIVLKICEERSNFKSTIGDLTQSIFGDDPEDKEN